MSFTLYLAIFKQYHSVTVFETQPQMQLSIAKIVHKKNKVGPTCSVKTTHELYYFQVRLNNEVVTVTLSKTVINFRRRDSAGICMDIMDAKGIPDVIPKGYSRNRGLLSMYSTSTLS